MGAVEANPWKTRKKPKAKHVVIQNKFEELKSKEGESAEVNNLIGTWEPIVVTVDSGAGANVAPKDAFPWIELQENDDSRSGRYYTTANGKRVYVLGEKTIIITSKEGVVKKMKFQIADVTRILASVRKITKAGNKVTMHKTGGLIKDVGGSEIEIEIENGVYVVKAHVKNSGFTRQGM